MITEDINLCGCMGPIANDPYCPCKMRNLGLTHSSRKDDPRWIYYIFYEIFEIIVKLFTKDLK